MLKYSYFDLSELSMSYDYTKKLRLNTRRPIKQIEYSRIIGSLMYAIRCTRRVITFSIVMLIRFTSNPEKPYWDAVQKLIREHGSGPTLHQISSCDRILLRCKLVLGPK